MVVVVVVAIVIAIVLAVVALVVHIYVLWAFPELLKALMHLLRSLGDSFLHRLGFMFMPALHLCELALQAFLTHRKLCT